ncbi:MAG TPA: AbrB/MazE/SpoVT family DNA-binding domain-containing protein [Candidatus Dormibacteraeota bacterium]|nr:AbrB/MazE/SpoVT family DNA-binding domain-containing protein [Candidatus Dormibacteraeota bacterium]
MQVTVSRWGNSLGIRVPKIVADDLHLTEGAIIDIEPLDGGYVLRPAARALVTRCSLAELVKQMGPAEREPREIDWGEPRGAEAW